MILYILMWMILIKTGEFFGFFYIYFILHCFICRPTVSEDAGNLIEVPLLSGYPAEGGISPQSAPRSVRTADSPGGPGACSCLAASLRVNSRLPSIFQNNKQLVVNRVLEHVLLYYLP
jgi:hypothetical protein